MMDVQPESLGGRASAETLSPLCCGLLQLQPFGHHQQNGQAADLNALTTAGAVLQHSQMKRVKLL
jgi:hypothetical protein